MCKIFYLQIKQNPNEPPCIHPTVKEHIGKAPINYSSSMETSDKGDNFLPVDMNIVKMEPVEVYVCKYCDIP